MSEMEDLGLLSKIRPPRLEDAGLEDCALPPDSIHAAFLKAAAAVGSRLTGSLDDDHGCVSDPWTEISPPSDALVGITPEASVPGPCATEKGGGALSGDGESASDVKGELIEGETEKKDEVVVVGGRDGGDGDEDCVDALRGLKIKERENEEGEGERDEKPTLVEGYF